MKKIVLAEGTKEFNEINKEWLKFQPKSEEELFRFIHRINTRFVFDYGACVHACVAQMRAILEYCNELNGYTGFQVGCMMWLAIKNVFLEKDAIGMELLKYENLLYPQYMENFAKRRLEKSQWDKLVEMAKEELKDTKYACKSVVEHWEKIANGWIPEFIELKKGEE